MTTIDLALVVDLKIGAFLLMRNRTNCILVNSILTSVAYAKTVTAQRKETSKKVFISFLSRDFALEIIPQRRQHER